MLDTNVVSHIQAWSLGCLKGKLLDAVSSSVEHLVNGGFSFDWTPYVLENCTSLDHPGVLAKITSLQHVRRMRRKGTPVLLRGFLDCTRFTFSNLTVIEIPDKASNSLDVSVNVSNAGIAAYNPTAKPFK